MHWWPESSKEAVWMIYDKLHSKPLVVSYGISEIPERTLRIVLKERPKPGYSINPSRKSKRAKTRWITKRLRLKSGNGSLKSRTKSEIRILVKM